jgi:hypothetical protein
MTSKFLPALALAAFIGISLPAFAQQTVTVDPYMAVLNTDPKTLEPGKALTLEFFVMDSKSMEPSDLVTVTASLSMPSMSGMIIDPPKVTKGSKPGHFQVHLTFPHAGDYRLGVAVKSKDGQATLLSFLISPGQGGTNRMAGMPMKASLGNWSAGREGSGTSWQPDSSPMFMKMLPSIVGFEVSTMGTVQAGYVDPGSKRVSPQLFTNSMIMFMDTSQVRIATRSAPRASIPPPVAYRIIRRRTGRSARPTAI